MRKRTNTALEHTVYGLDCIDLSYYIPETDCLSIIDVEDIMIEIQTDYLNDHLPSDAMYVFSHPMFHHDVFHVMDEDQFASYLSARMQIDVEFDPNALAEYYLPEGFPHAGTDRMAI